MSRKLLVIRIWLVLMVIAISLTGTSAFAQSGTVVRVDPSALTVQVNNSVNLSIKVDNVVNLTAVELHLSFNPNVLEVVQMANGGFVAADFSAQNTFDNTAGTIDYAIAQMNRNPAQGSGALLNITFRAKANGSSTVALRSTQAVPSGLLLSDQNGIAIQASWANGSVTVGNATPVTPTVVTPTPVTPTVITPTPNYATPVPGAILGTHIVRWGETLYCIGRAYGVTPWAIANVNGVWWPYMIFPNQSLLIPNARWSPIPAGPVCQAQFTTSVPTSTPPVITATPIPVTTVPYTPIPPVPPSACRAYYIVRPGDNLYRIGLLYGISYTEIARVNNIVNPRVIYSGQQLCIP